MTYLSMCSIGILGTSLDEFCSKNLKSKQNKTYNYVEKFILVFYSLFNLSLSYQRSAILIGVVRHDVNTSAGKSGFIGKI